MNNEHQSMYLHEAQKKIEFESTDKQGRALREELLAREEQLGVKIMTRRKRRSRTVYKVTLASIRKHCPDLMPSKADSLLKEAREYLSGIDARIDDRVAEQIAERVDPRIGKLERSQERTAETVRDLCRRVKQLADMSGPS